MKRALYLLSVGMAMFSMFFGAGNVLFPLIVGQVTTDKTLFALIGLVITAVGVPFTGIFAMTLYDGDYRAFFSRLGVWPGFLIAVIIMGLIGPFGAIPRCIALSYSTTSMFSSFVSVIPFSILACLTIYATTIKKARIMDLVGWILTPFFLLSIAAIVVMGIYNHPETLEPSRYSISESFIYGLNSGYNTMDLLASFFFCSVVMQALRRISTVEGKIDQKKLVSNALISSAIGASLLAAVYIGMSYVAALNSTSLASVKADVLLGTLALHVLGPSAGIVTCIAVIMACLTTAIALAAVFAEFLQHDVLKGRINYKQALIVTLLVTFFVSTLEFSGIVRLLAPVMQVLYPALLALCLINIGYKLLQRSKKEITAESAENAELTAKV